MTRQQHHEEDRQRQFVAHGEAQRALLEAVVDQSPFGELIIEAPSGSVILCNARARYLLGETLHNIHDRRGRHADGRLFEPHEWPLARAMKFGEIVIDEEVQIERPDGRRFITLARAAPVRDSAGRIVAAVGTLVDVTQRKREQEHDRLLADAGVVLAGEREHAELVRRLAEFLVPRMADRCEVYVTRDDGQLDETPAIIHPADAAPGGATWAAELSDVARSGVAALYDGAALSAGGSTAIIAPLISRGRTVGVLALVSSGSGRTFDEVDLMTARELAARAALAIDNARHYEAAQAATRHRDHVLAVVAHDLRGPLAAIRMTAFGLAREGDAQGGAPGLRRQGELIERAVGRMARLIDDLVDLGALQRGRLAIQLGPERADEMVRDAIDLHQFAAAEREVTLAGQVPPGLPLITCDRNRILQVLGNLIGNALKVTTLGGSITVRVDRAGGQVHFAVADTGPGISEANQARLFEPFWRGNESTHRGMGLGLVIVKGIVTAHGGRIWVESALGSGSTFHFTLPAST